MLSTGAGSDPCRADRMRPFRALSHTRSLATLEYGAHAPGPTGSLLRRAAVD
jgi:hypothetical protein